jgi:diamine N-acetyltransferase
LTIREATIADLPQLRALAVSIFTVTFEKSNKPEDFKTYMDEAFAEEKMKAEFSESDAVYIVAMEGETMAGYARVRENREADSYLGINNLELQRLYADIPWQGKGVANLLLNACEKTAFEKGKDWIWLGVWEHNPKAQHYYRKHGYERFSEHSFMMGNDKQTDWLMRKRISTPII